MPRHADIHPADLQTRRHLTAALRDMRAALNVGQADLAARLLLTHGAISRFERRDPPNPHITTVQRYTRALSHIACWQHPRRVLHLCLHGLPHIDLGAEGDLLRRMTRARDPERADAAERSLMLARLTATRHHLRLGQRDIAARCGITVAAVCQVEADDRDPLLSTYQRYARALGGRLAVRIRPIDVADPGRARQALAGEVEPGVLSRAEKVEAARLLLRRGDARVSDVCRRLNVSGSTAKTLLGQARALEVAA